MTSPDNDLVEKFGLGTDWDATSHVAFLRAAGGGSAGYTAGLIEALYNALTLQSERIAALQAERDEALSLIRKAHAVMRECGWQLAVGAEPIGDGILEAACSELEADFREFLCREV